MLGVGCPGLDHLLLQLVQVLVLRGLLDDHIRQHGVTIRKLRLASLEVVPSLLE